MARAHFVKKARKDYPNNSIKKGDSYWWWKFPYSGVSKSKTKPRASQLTQSEYYGQLYDLQDEIGNLVADDTLQSVAEDIASRLRDLASEQEDKLSNMPDSLQSSSTGELLQQRADDCNTMADEFENIDFDVPELDEDDTTTDEDRSDHEEEVENYWSEKLDEIQGISIEIN